VREVEIRAGSTERFASILSEADHRRLDHTLSRIGRCLDGWRPIHVSSTATTSSSRSRSGSTTSCTRPPRRRRRSRRFHRAVAALLDDPDRAGRLGQQAAIRVRDLYLPVNHYLHEAELLERVLA
jgi:hypothetical protein